MAEYSLLAREVEDELLPACQAFGIGVIPYFPLAAGVLTGKYREGEPAPPGTRGHQSDRCHQTRAGAGQRPGGRLGANGRRGRGSRDPGAARVIPARAGCVYDPALAISPACCVG